MLHGGGVTRMNGTITKSLSCAVVSGSEAPELRVLTVTVEVPLHSSPTGMPVAVRLTAASTNWNSPYSLTSGFCEPAWNTGQGVGVFGPLMPENALPGPI